MTALSLRGEPDHVACGAAGIPFSLPRDGCAGDHQASHLPLATCASAAVGTPSDGIPAGAAFSQSMER